MYKIESFLNTAPGAQSIFKISDERSDMIYDHMKRKAMTRIEEYTTVAQALVYLFGEFEFQNVTEVMYAISLYQHNKEKVDRVPQLNARRVGKPIDGKPYVVTMNTTPLGIHTSIQILEEDFGSWMSDVVMYSKKKNGNSNVIFPGDEDDDD